jgi:hypothetical protein
MATQVLSLRQSSNKFSPSALNDVTNTSAEVIRFRLKHQFERLTKTAKA